MGSLPVSVVVPSWRRPRELTRCLEALQHQMRAGDEILPVVRPEDSESREALEALCAGGDSAIRPVDVEQPGLVAALRAGLEAAAQPVVCFTDDDAVPRSGWLTRITDHFESDPRIGAVGGRDWIHVGGATNTDSAARVGEVRWFGRVVGNHHLGVGGPRDVQILKGVNMSFRRAALGEVGFDESLRGTSSQTHNEVGLCLELRRRGWRILYDPAVAVDHYLAARPEDERSASVERSEADVADAAHNQFYGLLAGLRGRRRMTAVVYQLLIGSRDDPGPLLCLERVLTRREGRAALLRTRAASRGRLAAFRTYAGRR